MVSRILWTSRERQCLEWDLTLCVNVWHCSLNRNRLSCNFVVISFDSVLRKRRDWINAYCIWVCVFRDQYVQKNRTSADTCGELNMNCLCTKTIFLMNNINLVGNFKLYLFGDSPNLLFFQKLFKIWLMEFFSVPTWRQFL